MAVSWRQSPVVGVVLVVIIVIALIFVIRSMGPKKSYYTADLMCEECGAVFQMKIATGEKFPLKCKECGKKAAYMAAQCMDCGENFVYKPVEFTEEKFRGMIEEIPKCPKCGSIRLSLIKRESDNP